MIEKLKAILARRPERPSPRSGAGRRLYAIGDIHGRRDLLDDLLDRVERDGGSHPEREKWLVFLGDYVDRGADSRGVIERLLLPPTGFTAVHLLGNHEDMMMRFLEDRGVGAAWLAFGGDATLASYGVDDPGEAGDGDRMRALQNGLAEHLPDSHRRFLRSLSLHHRDGDYLFVHAGIRPGVALDHQEARDLIWIRERFFKSTRDHGMVVVHGHSIVPEVEFHANRIAVDTGAYASGKLSCLVLDGAEAGVIQTI